MGMDIKVDMVEFIFNTQKQFAQLDFELPCC